MSTLSNRVNTAMNGCLDETDCWLLDTMKRVEHRSYIITDYSDCPIVAEKGTWVTMTMYDKDKQFMEQINLTPYIHRMEQSAQTYMVSLMVSRKPHYTLVNIRSDTKSVRPVIATIVMSAQTA